MVCCVVLFFFIFCIFFYFFLFFFFFQAEDGIRDLYVTGVQTCALPILIAEASRHGAAIAGVPAVDTVKQVERTANGAIITATVPRERVVMAQTPQGFRFSVIKKAFDDAMADGFTGTDEASLAERAGNEVAVVMGSARNIKITTPDDMELAEFFLSQDRRRSNLAG